MVRYVPELGFPRTREPSALGKQTPVQNGPQQCGENSPNLVQPISQPNLAQCTLCWQFGDQKDLYLAL